VNNEGKIDGSFVSGNDFCEKDITFYPYEGFGRLLACGSAVKSLVTVFL
jgi:hypothetical protein